MGDQITSANTNSSGLPRRFDWIWLTTRRTDLLADESDLAVRAFVTLLSRRQQILQFFSDTHSNPPILEINKSNYSNFWGLIRQAYNYESA